MIPIPSRDGAWIGSAALTLIAATLPAAINWWTDRRLLGKGDDPALPELLASRRRVNLRAMAIGFAFVIVLGGGNAAWGIPLLVALLIAATSAREAENSASRARKKTDKPFTRKPMLIASMAPAA